MSGSTRVSRYQKGKTRKVKTNLDLLEQEIVSGSGICWAYAKSAPHPRQPRQHTTTQFFTGRMPILPPNQQRQSTEGKEAIKGSWFKLYRVICQKCLTLTHLWASTAVHTVLHTCQSPSAVPASSAPCNTWRSSSLIHPNRTQQHIFRPH